MPVLLRRATYLRYARNLSHLFDNLNQIVVASKSGLTIFFTDLFAVEYSMSKPGVNIFSISIRLVKKYNGG